MVRFLHISVRFYEGRYHGADGWPPSPARLFQALVAGAAEGAVLSRETVSAMEWLETLAPPTIAAPRATSGRTFTPMVQNNDLDAVRGDPRRHGELRIPKPTRPWIFDQGQPLLYSWEIQGPCPEQAQVVCAIADRLYQLGRGIDPAWAAGALLEPREAESALLNHPGMISAPAGPGDRPCPTNGSLKSLVRRHAASRHRFRQLSDAREGSQGFAQPPKPAFQLFSYDVHKRYLDYDLRNESRFAARPLTAAAAIATALRDGAAARLSEALPELAGHVERFVVGRGAGPSEARRRIRIVPLPSIGAEHTDPSIRRVRVEVPATCPIRLDDLRWSFDGLECSDSETGELCDGRLVSADETGMVERFTREARVFRSITPVALPVIRVRAPAGLQRGSAALRVREHRTASAAVRQALRHIGEPARPEGIRVQREPFHPRGHRAELFASGSRFPARSLWHVELAFAAPVAGPLVIGDGRFCGLGLMVPTESHRSVLILEIPPETRVHREDAVQLLRALRRALMSRARNSKGEVETLFSGHEPDGSPATPGHHAHIFLAADQGPAREAGGRDAIRRLIVAAPWAVDHRVEPQDGQRARFDRVVTSLTELLAGRLGRFRFSSPHVPADSDTLARSSRTWRSVSPYIATKNMKSPPQDPENFVKCDLVAECSRRGFPGPRRVHVLDASVGPRGGNPRARMEIEFVAAVPGPLMLGRTSHLGGGLFHAFADSGADKAK